MKDFTENYNSSYHSGIQGIPERLEIFDEAELIRTNIKHNRELKKLPVVKGDFVRLANKRGTFQKEGQRYTGRIFIVENVGLNSIKVQGYDNKFKMSDKADKRLREREGIIPNRSTAKRTTRSRK